jgi:hypothetical protein
MEAYLGGHVDDFVVHSGDDDPGALSYLILGAVAAGGDPTDFGTGHDDLVTRLENTRQSDGLFGAADPTYDGAFRQGLGLLALHAAGHSDSAAADWLADQQCDDGSWTAFRSDTSVACPPVDTSTFTGPDTNSTALAALGLESEGRNTPADDGADALLAVRNGDGAWGYLSLDSQPTDANSTGLVVTALRAIKGSQDSQGAAALLALQEGCDADAADAGGVQFQAGFGPDALATAQAIPALADVVLPVVSATMTTGVPEVCPAVETTSTTSTTSASSAAPTPDSTHVAAAELARTGRSATTEAGVALILVGLGAMLTHAAYLRRRRVT